MEDLLMDGSQSSKREDEFIRAYNALCSDDKDDSEEHFWHGKDKGMKADEFFEINNDGAQMNIPSALCDLGYCYEYAIGTEKDLQKAFDAYKRAADIEDAVGLESIGRFYENGIVVEKDLEKAFSLYEKSAHRGDGVGMFRLANCYLNGIGTKTNEETAFDLYIKSAYFGYIGAVEKIKYCLKKGIGVKRDKEKANELDKIVSQNCAVDAMNVLKELYKEHGIM